MELPPQSGDSSSLEYAGTIKQLTKDEIVLVTGIREGRNEYYTPVLGQIPYIKKYFKHVAIGREEVMVRIPIASIATFERL